MLGRTTRRTAQAIAIGVICTVGTVTRATTVFDNLNLPPEVTVFPTSSDGRFAQQFLSDESDTVVEIAVRLSRVGDPTGSLTFELWSDNGVDQPDLKLAGGDLGEISDVAAIPNDATDFVFANPMSGLTPGQAYWIVANYSNVNNNLDNDIGWSVTTSDAGSNGASFGYTSEDGGSTWQAHGDNSFFFDFWHQMAVITLPAPEGSVLTAGALAGFFVVGSRRKARRPTTG